MSWPRDDAKLDRVRALMGEHDLDALVVRAPDNVLYLTNFWGMKGYDAVVFPREGEPVLVCLEASEADAERTAWTSEVRLFRGYDESDPRPPGLRALDLARQLSSEYDRVGIELSLGTQAADRMVGELAPAWLCDTSCACVVSTQAHAFAPTWSRWPFGSTKVHIRSPHG